MSARGRRATLLLNQFRFDLAVQEWTVLGRARPRP